MIIIQLLLIQSPVIEMINEIDNEEFNSNIPQQNFISLNELKICKGKYTMKEVIENKQKDDEKKKMMKQADNTKLKLKETLANRVRGDLKTKEEEENAKRQQILLKEEIKRQQELQKRRRELMIKYYENDERKNEVEKKPRLN